MKTKKKNDDLIGLSIEELEARNEFTAAAVGSSTSEEAAACCKIIIEICPDLASVDKAH